MGAQHVFLGSSYCSPWGLEQSEVPNKRKGEVPNVLFVEGFSSTARRYDHEPFLPDEPIIPSPRKNLNSPLPRTAPHPTGTARRWDPGLGTGGTERCWRGGGQGAGCGAGCGAGQNCGTADGDSGTAALTVAAQGALPHGRSAQIAPTAARGAGDEAVTAAAFRRFSRSREDVAHVGQQPRGPSAPPQPPRCPGTAGAPQGSAVPRLRAGGNGAGRSPPHGAGRGGAAGGGARPHGWARHGTARHAALRPPGGRCGREERGRAGASGRPGEETRRGGGAGSGRAWGFRGGSSRGDPPGGAVPPRGSIAVVPPLPRKLSPKDFPMESPPTLL